MKPLLMFAFLFVVDYALVTVAGKFGFGVIAGLVVSNVAAVFIGRRIEAL